MKNKKVSLIIPVYNTEKQYLQKCLESAIAQTYPNMEIILVDDGSTDGSADLVDEFAEKDHRVLVIHQQNGGESNARNTGLRAACGDYIAFMDCDDFIEPQMYEQLVQALEENDADMAISGFYREFISENRTLLIENEKEVEPKVFDGKQLLRYLYERDAYRSFAYMWDKLYRKELMVREDGELICFDESMKLGGDVVYLAECALNTKKAVYLDKAFYHYVQRENSGCHLPDLERKQDNIRAYEIVSDKFAKLGVEAFVQDLIKRILVYHSSYAAEIAYEQKNPKLLKKFQEIMRRYEKEYRRLNAGKTEWLLRFEEILTYHIE